MSAPYDLIGVVVADDHTMLLTGYSSDISNYVAQLRTAINGETGGGT